MKNQATFTLLENYKNKQQLLDSMKDIDTLIIRSGKITKEIMDSSKILK